MCRQPEKYLPFVERVAGYYLAFCEKDDQGRIVDLPSIERAAGAMTELQGLTDDEGDFVHYAAVAAIYEGNLDDEVRSKVLAWIDGGACI